jgi:peroxiredoxin
VTNLRDNCGRAIIVFFETVSLGSTDPKKWRGFGIAVLHEALRLCGAIWHGQWAMSAADFDLHQRGRVNMANNATVGVGDPAPPFSVKAVNKDGELALSDYVGRAPLFLNLMRGLHCPFCRRAMTQVRQVHGTLAEMGVETAIVIVTPRDRALAYYRYRPTPVTVGSDPAIESYRRFGVPLIQFTDNEDDWPRKASMNTLMNTPIDAGGYLNPPLPIGPAMMAKNEEEGYKETPEEEAAHNAVPAPLDSRFMIDRDGMVRWVFIEAQDQIVDFGKLPSTEHVLEAARSVAN